MASLSVFVGIPVVAIFLVYKVDVAFLSLFYVSSSVFAMIVEVAEQVESESLYIVYGFGQQLFGLLIVAWHNGRLLHQVFCLHLHGVPVAVVGCF